MTDVADRRYAAALGDFARALARRDARLLVEPGADPEPVETALAAARSELADAAAALREDAPRA